MSVYILLTESTKLSPPTVMTLEKTTPDIQDMKAPISVVEYYPETSRRLNDFETTLSSLQDTKQKTEDDMSEIKQWRDNFVTEYSDMGIKVENLKTKEPEKDKRLEKLSLDMKEYENNLHTLNKEMRVYTDKTDDVTQEIKRHSQWISAIQEDTTKTFDILLSKCGSSASNGFGLLFNILQYRNMFILFSTTDNVVMCKLLQQRLMSIDKMIETYNQNSENRKGKIKKIETLEKEVFRLSHDLQAIAVQQVKPSKLGFIASQGRWEGKQYMGSPVIAFKAVQRNVGNHFDPNTGVFTAPVAGLYKASLTIKQTGDNAVGAAVVRHSGDVPSRLGDVLTKNKSVEASDTFMVLMKTGDILFSITGYVDCYCTHFSCSLLSD
ncbi:uncharacterized protein LOC131957622 [Physella acuta]|uniref:uncharacterized protein LOC131957622 n=1 Tax=Physella acuta TaxID=109671 RepID=UPI0027DB89C8|nr:uncharacterized protein LOC131957622 [Physella acuta]